MTKGKRWKNMWGFNGFYSFVSLGKHCFFLIWRHGYERPEVGSHLATAIEGADTRPHTAVQAAQLASLATIKDHTRIVKLLQIVQNRPIFIDFDPLQRVLDHSRSPNFAEWSRINSDGDSAPKWSG